MKFPSWLLSLLGLSRRVERSRAETAMRLEARALGAELSEDVARFDAAMAERASPNVYTLGKTPEGVSYLQRPEDLWPHHLWVVGATGSGKSTLVATWFRAALRRLLAGEPLAFVFVVLQGFLGDMVLRAMADALGRASPGEIDACLSRLLVARFFRGTHLPEWQLLTPETSVPTLVQAAAVGEVLESAVGAPLGGRQETALTMLLALAIEQRLTLAVLRRLVYEPEALRALAERSALAEVRLYALHRLVRERAQLEGIASRLDALLRVEAARAVLAGPGTIDWHACFRPGSITLLDFSGEGMGAESAKSTLAGIALKYLSMAIFDARRRREGHTVIVADEVQEALTPATTRLLSRWVTTTRAFDASLVSIHQSVAQLPRDFYTLLSTNIRLRVVGRGGREDAVAAQEFLPPTGRVLRARRPGEPLSRRAEFLSRAEEVEAQTRRVMTLPPRHFLLADRLAPFAPREIIAETFDVPSWEAVPGALRTRLERGRGGVRVRELLRRAEALEAEASPSTEASPPSPEEPTAPRRASRRGRTKVVEAPSVVEAAKRWTRSPRGRR